MGRNTLKLLKNELEQILYCKCEESFGHGHKLIVSYKEMPLEFWNLNLIANITSANNVYAYARYNEEDKRIEVVIF